VDDEEFLDADAFAAQLFRLAPTLEGVATKLWGLYTHNMQLSLDRIKREVEEANRPLNQARRGDSKYQETATWRDYYPGGDKLQGDGHISENWDVSVGTKEEGSGDTVSVIGALVNYHPGAAPMMFGTQELAQISARPTYPNPDGGTPGFLVFPNRSGEQRGPWAFLKAATRAPSRTHPEVAEAMQDAIARTGYENLGKSIVSAFREAQFRALSSPLD
jgi:hypothetical protein